MAHHASRRQFLRQSLLIGMAPAIPAFLRSTALASANNSGERILVVVQLDGGNDGINSVVPFANEGYAQHRKELRLGSDRLVKINDQAALHPSLRPLADLLDDGRLAIVEAVGYPNPNRSHDVSMAIWQTARMDRHDHKSFGWIGRAMDLRSGSTGGAADAVLLGSENPPVALRGRRSASVSLAHLDDLKLRGRLLPQPSRKGEDDDLLAFARRAFLDARATADLIDDVEQTAQRERSKHYADSQLAGRLSSIARLIKSGFSTRVYYAIQAGYDTHAAQLPTHARLLNELAGALHAFQNDLQSAGLADRVLTLCFSEFGRRVRENASLGTDHGTAGPVFVMGSQVNPGLIGQPADLTDLDGGDLKMQFDFRQVYASLLRDWLSVPVEPVLGGSFPAVDLVRT